MCTAIHWNGFFGRNLDLWYAYGESVVITPRHYPFSFRLAGEMEQHYAMIGMAFADYGYPLYYEATNEKGLSMAGLHFPGTAVYASPSDTGTGVASFELIPWILGQCAVLADVRELLRDLRIVNLSFREDLPASPLHWIIADKEASLVLESTANGLQVYENPVGVLTNNPVFPVHLARLAEYTTLSPRQPEARFGDIPVSLASGGMGAVGLPGDWSSASRFVRAAFVKCSAQPEETAEGNAVQFFHMLDAAAMPKGAVIVPHGQGEAEEITVYACCCDMERGVYYYKTYENSRITAVDLHGSDLDSRTLTVLPMDRTPDIRYLY